MAKGKVLALTLDRGKAFALDKVNSLKHTETGEIVLISDATIVVWQTRSRVSCGESVREQKRRRKQGRRQAKRRKAASQPNES